MDHLFFLSPLFEILVIAFTVNYLLSFFWNTRSMDLFFGLIAYLLIFAASSWLHLPILNHILLHVSNVAAIAILIIFQPELRTALSKLSFKGKRHKEMTEFDRFLDQLANSAYKMADKRNGALILLEKEDSLEPFIQNGISMQAQFSSQLLESIFTPSSPLHDGAVIIRNSTILAASVILPLAEENLQLATSMGTRHRAALSASQESDSLVIVISEENGKVSIARDGIITRGVKIDRFKGIIRSNFTPSPQKKSFKGSSILNWIKS